MKKCMLPLLVLALCLLLAACDSGRSISGEVVDIYQDPERGTALILRTGNDKRLAVFLDEESFVFGLAAINSDEYYKEQGALYDLQAELERAYAAYQADPEHFSSYWVSQDTSPSASNGQIMYFQTNLFLTLAGNTGEERAVCAAFDRKTGAYIPTANLFTCPEADIGKKLLDLVAANGSVPDEPTLKRETLAAFQLEYVTISSHGLDMTFPQSTLPSQEYPYIVVVDRNDLPAVLHSWAIPDAPVA